MKVDAKNAILVTGTAGIVVLLILGALIGERGAEARPMMGGRLDPESAYLPIDAMRGEIQTWILSCASHRQSYQSCVHDSQRLFREVLDPEAPDTTDRFGGH